MGQISAKHFGVSVLALGISLGVAPRLYAQAPNAVGDNPGSQVSSSEVSEIIVTAQKRSENLQRVPVSVAVATASQLTNSGVTDVQSLKMVAPGVEVQSNNGYAYPIIRGVASKGSGAGFESPIAFYVDGVYYANATANILSFNNVSQIEVLKGPQGTLFGRNATGGLIQVTTRDPRSTFGGDVSLSYGNYKTFKGTLYLTGGLSQNLSADLAVQGTAMGDGYGTNLFNGKDVYKIQHDISARSKWLWNAGPATQLRFIADYTDTRNSMNAQRIPLGGTAAPPFGPSYGGSEWDVDGDTMPLVTVKTGGVSLRVDHDFDAVQFASTSAYRKTDFTFDNESDFTRTRGRVFGEDQNDWQFSQEVQLLSPKTSRLKWVVGAYYFKAGSRYPRFILSNFGVAATAFSSSSTLSNQNTDSISGFAQATAEILSGLSLTAGLRYTHEKRELTDASTTTVALNGTATVVAPGDQSLLFKKLTWRLAMDYQVTSDVLAYISYNRGFKSGGFNASALTLPPFEPEVLDAYETGLKTTFLDRHVRLNVAGYYYDYKNVQAQRSVNGSTGIYNGAAAEIYGFDGQLQTQISSKLSLDFGYQFAHGKYKQFPGALIAAPSAAGGYTLTPGDASGNTTLLTPKHSLSAVVNYTVPFSEGKLGFNASYYYNSGFFQDPDDVLRQPSYSLINSSVRWTSPGDRYSISIWGNNLTNKAVTNLYSVNSQGGIRGVARANYAAPRTYGATLGLKF